MPVARSIGRRERSSQGARSLAVVPLVFVGVVVLAAVLLLLLAIEVHSRIPELH